MKKLLLITALFVLVNTGCTDAQKSKFYGLGDEFKVELVNCDGSVTHSWVSTGKVQSEDSSDGYYFRDKATNKLIEVTGTLIISEL